MKDPLKYLTIAVTGDFGLARTHEKMRQWIECNGGTFAPKFTTDVTHLVCSKEHLRKAVRMVREARKIDSLHIVSFDWLEDSLLQMRPKRESTYLLHRRVQSASKVRKARKATSKAAVKKGVKAFEQSCADFHADMFSSGYHIYTDTTGFAYDITLARANLVANKHERYQLKLFETHSPPHLYATHIRYAASGTLAKHVLAPLGSAFETAIAAFRQFFHLKTRRAWEERFLDRAGAGPGIGEGGWIGNISGSGSRMGGAEGEGEGEGTRAEVAFVYTPPGEGEPRGLLL